jgi:hypothetical protein
MRDNTEKMFELYNKALKEIGDAGDSITAGDIFRKYSEEIYNIAFENCDSISFKLSGSIDRALMDFISTLYN